ncbi:YbhN family protein [Streptomyces antimycoticus]|uniref:Lysylphosphatidylglycerol synthase domain-containing protein n=1 Tax=Streptomyces mordarskii TaxID=1226758 RepID=A0ABP3NJM0_9ACTN|nr:lysylphosphatidylglycerol synthase transmembrane domain-containing protein [Streptomyces antimycoticus]WJD97361.1 lysylphosphatidylglycerol synthase transmembrane domain-containing protein [Streptomyces antimycoticus]WTA83907.1 flippase-like domain-containing protein [Streptomyces antimycoticus]
MIRDQEETAKQQGAQPPEEEARTPESLPHSKAPSGGRQEPPEAGDDCGPDGPEGHVDRVSGDEPLLPARVHRPADLLRLLLGVLGMAVVLAIAAFAHGTTAGLEKDIGHGANQAPPLLIDFAGLTAGVAVLVLPVAFAFERLIKRDGLRIADGVLAAVLAHGVSLATDLWVARAAPDSIREALTQPAPGGAFSDPVHGYLAPVIAYMTAVGMARRPRWRVAMWCVLLLDAFAVLVGGYTTPFSIILTVLIGWTVAYGTLYAVGSPNVRPTGQNLLGGLRRVGFNPVSAMRAEEPEDEHGGHGDRSRRYVVTLEDGPPLDVTVVDREQQAQGFFYGVWQRLTLRTITPPRSLQSLRQALEQEALLAYAAIAAGANAAKLIATSELGPDAVMLVYEHVAGRPLHALPDEAITDELLAGAWHQVQALQSRRIAHRRLDSDALLVDRNGTVILTDLRGGEIAAGDVVLRMDVAQLLTTLGLRVGAERSVAAAVAVLGPDAVADSLPLLQPLALGRGTRATLRQLARERAQRQRDAVLEASHAAKEAREAEEAPQEAGAPEAATSDRRTSKAEKQAEKRAIEEAMEDAREEDLLSQIRQQVLLVRPQAPIEPERLERIKPRTLVSFCAGAFAAYFLLSQFTHLKLGALVGEANWIWVVFALVFSALTYLAAALSLLGFVPEKVPLPRTVLAQVAASFVKLVAPAAVGGVALNTRFLQRAGVRPGLAVASVGASQLFGLASHIVLLLTFGYITGTERTPALSPSRTVIAGLLTAAVLVLVVTAIPVLRKFVSTRVRSLFAGVVPRMLDVLQRPKKLLTGIGGTLLLTAANVMCLDASIRAFGGELSYASIAVVFLAGNALGSAAPTPGGVGAVEAALIAGLTFAGLPYETAAPAVLLFRLMVFWLPVLPGWVAFTHLTRKEAL